MTPGDEAEKAAEGRCAIKDDTRIRELSGIMGKESLGERVLAVLLVLNFASCPAFEFQRNNPVDNTAMGRSQTRTAIGDETGKAVHRNQGNRVLKSIPDLPRKITRRIPVRGNPG